MTTRSAVAWVLSETMLCERVNLNAFCEVAARRGEDQSVRIDDDSELRRIRGKMYPMSVRLG